MERVESGPHVVCDCTRWNWKESCRQTGADLMAVGLNPTTEPELHM